MDKDFGGEFSLLEHEFVELAVRTSVELRLDRDERVKVLVSVGKDTVDDEND